MLLVLKQSEKMFPVQHQPIWFQKSDKKYPTPPTAYRRVWLTAIPFHVLWRD